MRYYQMALQNWSNFYIYTTIYSVFISLILANTFILVLDNLRMRNDLNFHFSNTWILYQAISFYDYYLFIFFVYLLWDHFSFSHRFLKVFKNTLYMNLIIFCLLVPSLPILIMCFCWTYFCFLSFGSSLAEN